MPYSSAEDLPDYVKKLSPHLKKIWMKAFNSAYKQYDDEKKAFMVANGAVKKYRESNSIDFDTQFKDDVHKFMRGEKREKERITNNYGDDFIAQTDEYFGRREDA